MSSLIYNSKATSANLLKLVKVVSVSRDLSHVIKDGVMTSTSPMGALRLLTFFYIVICGGHRLLSRRIQTLPLTRLASIWCSAHGIIMLSSKTLTPTLFLLELHFKFLLEVFYTLKCIFALMFY